MVGKHSGGRPPLGGDHEGLLDRLLGEVDVTEEADQYGNRATVLSAEHTSDLRGGKGRHARHQLQADQLRIRPQRRAGRVIPVRDEDPSMVPRAGDDRENLRMQQLSLEHV